MRVISSFKFAAIQTKLPSIQACSNLHAKAMASHISLIATLLWLIFYDIDHFYWIQYWSFLLNSALNLLWFSQFKAGVLSTSLGMRQEEQKAERVRAKPCKQPNSTLRMAGFFSLSLSLSQSAAQMTSSRTTSSVDTVAKSRFYTICKASKAQNKYQELIDDPRKPCQVLTKPSMPIKPSQTSTRAAS